MKNRDDIRDQFSPLLDGELSPEERAAVEAALSDDAELLRELDSFKRVDDLFRALPAENAPDGFEDAVRERTHPRMVAAAAAAPPHRAKPRRYWTAGLAAAAVLVVAAGTVLFNVSRHAAPSQLAANYDMAVKETAKPSPSFRDAPAAASAPAMPEEERLEALGYTSAAAPATAAPATAAPDPVAAQQAMPADAAAGVRQREAEEKAEDVDRIASLRQELDAANNGVSDTREEQPRRAMKLESAPAPAPPPAKDMPAELDSDNGIVADEMIAAGTEVQLAPPAATSEETAVAAPAPAPASPPLEGSLENRSETTGRKAMVAPSAPSGKMAKVGKDDSGKRQIGARAFTFRDGVWFEDGYNAEPTNAIDRNSASAKTLLEQDKQLSGVFGLAGPVVFKANRQWYKLAAAQTD